MASACWSKIYFYVWRFCMPDHTWQVCLAISCMRWSKVIFYAPKLLAVWGRENHIYHLWLIPSCLVIKSSWQSLSHRAKVRRGIASIRHIRRLSSRLVIQTAAVCFMASVAHPPSLEVWAFYFVACKCLVGIFRCVYCCTHANEPDLRPH